MKSEAKNYCKILTFGALVLSNYGKLLSKIGPNRTIDQSFSKALAFHRHSMIGRWLIELVERLGFLMRMQVAIGLGKFDWSTRWSTDCLNPLVNRSGGLTRV